MILCLVKCPGAGKNDRVKSYGIQSYTYKLLVTVFEDMY